MQAGFERCLFLYSIKLKTQEIREISLVRQPVRIQMPLLWPRTSTSYIHKVAEDSTSFATPVKDLCNSIRGR